MSNEESDERKSDNPWPRRREKEEDMKLRGILIFGLIGATATSFAERIRRMQSVFKRERNKFKKSYQNWQENGEGAYHQHSQRNYWYWNTEKSFRDHGSNFKETPRATESAPLSHHYSVLGLDR